MQNGGEFNGPHGADTKLVFRRGQSGDSCGFEVGLTVAHVSDARAHPLSLAVKAPMMVEGSMKPQYTLFAAASNMAAGLAGGFSGLAAGVAIGIVGDIGTRALGQQPKLFVGMILILIFAEALGLYGLIVALIFSASPSGECPS